MPGGLCLRTQVHLCVPQIVLPDELVLDAFNINALSIAMLIAEPNSLEVDPEASMPRWTSIQSDVL